MIRTTDAGGTGHWLRTFWTEHADCLPAAVAAAGVLFACWVTA